VVTLSARTGEGIDKLRDILRDKVTLFAGNSGVGKSTLINTLIPGLDLKTAEISAVHDTGMHTTTFSELFHLPDGGSIIDTPGVRGFGTVDFDIHEVDHFFPDLFALSKDCRFGNCTHTHEPGCAVRAALERNEIAESRYTSYLSILEDSSEDKYRKGY
jgi:ribosome biogenesis GTPase